MASLLQTSLLPGSISLALFKFSYCTTQELKSKLVWTHLPERDRLFAVFDRVNVGGFTSQRRTLKLLRGGDLLEQIELDNLALQARLDEERNRSQILQDADRHVLLVVKKPMLAMRYQLPNGQIRRIQLKFPTDAGYDAAINALQDLGLPIVDKNQTAIDPSSKPSTIYPSYQHGLPPPRPAGLLPSPNFTNRPYTSGNSEYRPFGSAPGFDSERPYTAPQPVSFSQTLPPKRSLPPQMQLAASAITPAFQTPEKLMLGAVEPGQPSVMPQAKKRAQAKTTKPKAVKNVAPTKEQEKQIEVLSLPSPSPIAARTRQAQTNGGEPQNPATTSGNILQSTSFDPAAAKVEAPFLASPRRIAPDQLSTEDGSAPAAAAAESHANDTAPSKTTTDTSARNVLVLRSGRQAMAEIAGNSPSPDSNHPASANTAQPAISKLVPSAGAEEVSAEEFMSGLDKFIREYHHLPAPEPRPSAADDLAAYAAQPDEVRQAIIKDMVLDFLGDENFIKLAEDMSKEWRRIGLGL
ncbi:MAG: hypothetical protein Q9195_009030 [Heterodermia aff. obscurata]